MEDIKKKKDIKKIIEECRKNVEEKERKRRAEIEKERKKERRMQIATRICSVTALIISILCFLTKI